jgi:integrase
VARRRFQTGQLYKKGKRRKVWIARWREDVLLPDGSIGRVRRGVLLGSVADLPTRRDAQLKLDERLRPVNQGVARPESTIALGAFVEQQWAVLVLPTFKRTTQHGYRAVLKVHVLPTWRDAPLREIDRLAIQQWVADRLRRGIGWQSVRNAWVLLSSILESAVEYGYLQTNPARGVKFPQKALKKKPALIAGSEFAKLLRELSETHRTMVSLIAATGLRIGELLALRWSSLDLQVGALTVRESVFEGQFQAPKTQRALRTIPLGPHAVRALSEHLARVMRKGEEDLVFGNSKGAPLRESKVLTTVLQPAAEGGVGACDVASVPPHPLVAAQRPERAGEDRAGATRAREHFDDAEHLHARRRRVTPQSDRSGRARIVRRFGPQWTTNGGRAGTRPTHK